MEKSTAEYEDISLSNHEKLSFYDPSPISFRWFYAN